MSAETDLGAIVGFVTDVSGSPLPGVTVIAQGPGNPRTVLTNAEGEYRLPNLPAGAYTVSFELPGFETKKKNAEVKAGQDLELNVTLQLATP